MRHRNPFVMGVAFLLVILSAACQKASVADDASRIAAGGNQTCLLESGGVKCWGKNNTGQLGNGATRDSNLPVAVTGLSGKVLAVAVGYDRTCVLMESAEAVCWGGQLADQSRFRSDAGFTALALGSLHACGVTARGGMMCWGANSFGGLGDGTTEERLTPVDVIGMSDGVTSVAAGGNFSCAVQGGGLKCWGSNNAGQLGNGTYEGSTAPVLIPGMESGVTAVAAGVFHACAIKANGEVWCWGENFAGELGDGTTVSNPSPVKVANLEGGVQELSLGGSHTCALTKTGGVKCWGGNSNGQLGDGSTSDRNSPVDVTGLTSGVVAIAAGGSHTCAVLTGGAVKCWGLNENGQLGNGLNQNSSTPVDVRM